MHDALGYVPDDRGLDQGGENSVIARLADGDVEVVQVPVEGFSPATVSGSTSVGVDLYKRPMVSQKIGENTGRVGVVAAGGCETCVGPRWVIYLCTAPGGGASPLDPVFVFHL